MANEPTTQQLVSVSEIRDEVAILKNGSMRAVIEVSAINFELRSEEEQVALLQNFQRFLNSVDFPIQIVISSRKMEIEGYLKYIQEQSEGLDELLKIQSAEYSRFVKELASLANIMSKKFYLAVPFYIYDNPQKSGLGPSLKSLFTPSSSSKGNTQMTDEQFASYKSQILQRAELVFDGLISLGLKTKILEGDELLRVLYGFYNPGISLSKTATDQK